MESRTTGGLLVGLHIFTGDDSTSAFAGKGKKRICSVQAICGLQFQRGFRSLGQIWDVLCASFTGIPVVTSTKHGTTFFVQKL